MILLILNQPPHYFMSFFGIYVLKLIFCCYFCHTTYASNIEINHLVKGGDLSMSDKNRAFIEMDLSENSHKLPVARRHALERKEVYSNNFQASQGVYDLFQANAQQSCKFKRIYLGEYFIYSQGS